MRKRTKHENILRYENGRWQLLGIQSINTERASLILTMGKIFEPE